MEPGSEDLRSSAYQLDTTTDELPPYKVLSDLSVLRSFHKEVVENAALLTCNEVFTCWAEDARVRVVGQPFSLTMEEPGQRIVSVALRRDCNYLATATTHRLMVRDLDRGGQMMLQVAKHEPSFRLIVWHPTQTKVLGTAFERELTTWEMGDLTDPRRFKVLVQNAVILDFSFSGEVPQIATMALEGGLIRTIDLDSEAVLFETRPHAMSALYANTLFVSHFPLGSLLTLGKSNNELSLWNWEKKEKMHTLTIKSNDMKLCAYLQGRIFLVDTKARTLTILATTELLGKLRFATIIDYALDIPAITQIAVRVTSIGDVEVLCLNKDSLDTFPIPDLKSSPELVLETKVEDDPRKRLSKPSKPEKRKKQPISASIPSEQITALQRKIEDLQTKLESGTVVTGIQERVDKVISDNMEKLSGIIREEQQKIQVSMKILLAQAFKEQFQSTILPTFEGAIKELFTQITSTFQEGVKEYSDRNQLEEAKFQSVLQHMKLAVETSNELTNKLGKTAFKQLKRVNELEVRLNERVNTVQTVREVPVLAPVEHQVPALKLELDRLLRNEEFEAAIGLVMTEREERVVYSVLNVINPAALYQVKPLSNGLSLRLCHRLLTQFPARTELPECVLWLQEICKSISVKGEDPSLVQNILEMMVSRSKTSPEISPAKETFFSKIMQDMQDRHR